MSDAEALSPQHVRLSGVRRAFGDGTVAVEPMDLAIVRGSFVAMIGPSGCGKSTLLRLIAGLDEPTSGTVEVDGRSPRARPRAEGSRSPVAVVFQDACLLPWRTVIDNVALPLELRGVPREEAREAARAPLLDVELADVERRYPDELSGGMRMRVSIARALATRPQLLLLDEPFAALDELTRQRLDDRLRALWLKHRMSVIFVTHSLAEAVFLAERAVVFSARPARIVLDHRIHLPRERTGKLRADAAFSREEAVLYAALEEGASMGPKGSSSLIPMGLRAQEPA